MFLPDSCDILFEFPCSACVNYVVANRERTIVAVVSDESLYFYLADTKLLACLYQREDENLREQGPFSKAFWKPDSSSICVMSKKCLNIYAVEIISNRSVFNLHDPPVEHSTFSRESSEFFLSQKRPKVNVTLSIVAHLEAEPTCVLSFKDEFIVCLMDGWLHRMSWTGTVLQDLSFNIRSFCAPSNQFSKKTNHHFASNSLHLLDIAPFLGGICVVLSDGRGALLNSSSTNFQPNSINAMWAGDMKNSCCCATNFKYRLIYFGTKSGEVVSYSRDDINETLIQLFVIRLTLKNGTEFLGRLSAVRQIRNLSPQGSVFAVIWDSIDGEFCSTSADYLTQNGTETNCVEDSPSLTPNAASNETPPALALFSPFGAQWWCSLEEYSGNLSSFHYTSLDWAFDGFQLWMGTTDGVQLINLIQSAESFHSRHVVMFGSDRIYISPSITSDQTVACSAPHFIWKLLRPPHNYISANGPIKLMATDFDCNRLLAIAGSHGFCFYNFKSFKWRMFRKEAQEQSLLLNGGLAIFENFIICSACNTDLADGERERIYAFHAERQLDLDETNGIQTNRILQMTLNRFHLLTFDVNSLIGIFSMSLSLENGQNDSLSLECLAEIRIAEFLPHPSCLISMDLTRLNFYSDAVPFCDDLDSLLVNISGHLLLLSPMQSQLSNDDGQFGKVRGNDEQTSAEFQLHPPTLIASFVEHFWTALPSDQQKNANTDERIAFLEDALWINAGCKNSKVWLPLSTDQNLENPSTNINQIRKLSRQSSRAFISRRIMLPIDLGIYPLCVNNAYLACGASCVTSRPKSSSAKLSDNASLATDDGSSSLSSFVGVVKNDFLSRLSVHTLVRVSEVFIHKLLKQLLKRNLGAFAFDLATACRLLPYFGHILELLLHDLLDEEATSSEPIPDPLLPTAVAFLREFPAEYLRTIVFCARKTELAFWSLLFSVSHHPRQLFQMCLKEGQLDTATSCLMILHSMENFKESSKLAFRLLEEALTKRKWTVAQDIVRFMHNISRAADQEIGLIYMASEVPDSPLQHKLSSLQSHYHYHQSKNTGFNSTPADDFPLFSSSLELDAKESSALRNRSISSVAKTAEHSDSRKITAALMRQNQQQKARKLSPQHKEKMTSNANLPLLNTSKSAGAIENGQNLADGYEKINAIFVKHAKYLLEDYALRDLGAFSSYLHFDLVSFFRENAFAVAPTEFPVILMKLHAQFNWPYPVSFSAPLPSHNFSVPYNGAFIDQMPNGGLAKISSSIVKTLGTDEANACGDGESETETVDSENQLENGGTFQKHRQNICCDWKVLGKIRRDTEVRGTAQTEAEMAFVNDILQRAEAFEWIYLLCILRQDVCQFKDRILTPMQTLPEGRLRTEEFLKKMHAGTQELFKWTESACPAYATIIRVFKDLVNAQKTL